MIIDFKENFILENDRVLLKPLSLDDFDALLPFSEGETEIWKYSLTSASGSSNLRNYIKAALKQRDLNQAYPFLVFDKLAKEVAGCTRFYDFQSVHNTIQLGYTWYGKRFQGTGINKNCKLLMLNHAFEDWKLDRVEFRADNNNKRSIAAMKSIGCVEEGVLRSNCAGEVGRRDSIVLSVLQNEWLDQKKVLLQLRIKDTEK